MCACVDCWHCLEEALILLKAARESAEGSLPFPYLMLDCTPFPADSFPSHSRNAWHEYPPVGSQWGEG